LERLVKQLWESKYKPVNTVARTETTATATSLIAPAALSKPVNQFAAYLHKHKAKAMAHLDDSRSSDDEYARYIEEKVEWIDDPMAAGSAAQIPQVKQDGNQYAVNTGHGR
jgi:hypothetical protein